MEVNINSLQKSIVSEQEQTTTLQNMWLRNQNQLVTLTKERDCQISDINNIKKKQTIMEQRKMRIEGKYIEYYYHFCDYYVHIYFSTTISSLLIQEKLKDRNLRFAIKKETCEQLKTT